MLILWRVTETLEVPLPGTIFLKVHVSEEDILLDE